MSSEQLLAEILRLPEEERLCLIDKVYGSIPAREEADADITPEFRAELDRRLADIDAHPNDEISWEEVSAEIDRRYKKA